MYLLALDLKKEEFVQAVGLIFFIGSVPLVVFFAMQKYLVRGLLAGSVK